MTNQIRTTAHYFEDDIGGERPLWAILTMQGEFLLVTECASVALEECDGLDDRERDALVELHDILQHEQMNKEATRLRCICGWDQGRKRIDFAYERNNRYRVKSSNS